MSVVFAAIAPHGGIAVAEAVAPEKLAAATAEGMAELGRRAQAANPETMLVLTPHGVHLEGHLAVVTASRTAGSLESARTPVRLECECDTELARAALAELKAAGLPSLGVSFGGHGEPADVMPMDWAVLIPLWFMGGRRQPPVRVVTVSPARDLSAAQHVAAGAALRRACDKLSRRVGVIASADHGHAHRADGPYGYDPASARYDQTVRDIVAAGQLERLLEIDPSLVAEARADSWWQMLMLHGLLGPGARADLVSYEAPTYFGMLCATLEP